MSGLTADALHRKLREGRRGGAFLIFGEEEYLKEEVVDALVAAHVDAGTKDFNFDQLRAADTTPETLASVAATPPLLADWRVLVLRDVQALASSSRARSTLEKLLERKIPGLLLVLTAQIPPGRAQFYDTLKKLTTPVECAALSDADLVGWLLERGATRDVQIEPAAARQLAGAIGSELGVLAQELNKLIEFVGDRRRIGANDVTTIVGPVRRVIRWDWFDLVSDRRFREARVALPVLLDSGENGVGLVIGLGTQFLRLAIAVSGGQRALESALPFNQKWLAGRIAKQARGWSGSAVDAALADLLRADRLLKSTSLTDTQVLEELLLRMQTRMTAVAA
jgi:DNA polymerase III subunit delta